MARSKETTAINKQRTEIANYLAAQIIPNHISPRDRDSFYRQKPVEDPEFEALYEAAGGDPTLYAILVAQAGAQEEIDEAKAIAPEKPDLPFDVGRNQKLAQATEHLKMLQLLEQQYRDPLEFPRDTMG